MTDDCISVLKDVLSILESSRSYQYLDSVDEDVEEAVRVLRKYLRRLDTRDPGQARLEVLD